MAEGGSGIAHGAVILSKIQIRRPQLAHASVRPAQMIGDFRKIGQQLFGPQQGPEGELGLILLELNQPEMEKGQLDVTVIFSEISDIEKVRGYFTKTINLIADLKKRQEGTIDTQRGIDVSIRDIPSLL